MNNKGDGVQIEVLISIVLIALVILVSIFFIVRFDLASKFGILPSNYTDEIRHVNDVEKLRYVIDSDIVEYYDGTSWQRFDKAQAVRLGFKEVSYSRTKDAFNQFYFNSKRSDPNLTNIPVGSSGCKKLEIAFGEVMNSNNENLNIKRADVMVLSVCDDVNSKVPTYVGLDGDIRFAKAIEDKSWWQRFWTGYKSIQLETREYGNEPFKSIILEASKWRDSVLNKPIKIDYNYITNARGASGEEVNTLEPKTIFVCVEKKGKDLWIDLQKQVAEGSACES